MKKLLSFACAIAVGLALTSNSLADYSDSSGDGGILDDSTPFASSIVVGVNELISDVEVSINMEHSWIGDVTATLTHVESGFSIILIPSAMSDSTNLGSDAGGNVLSPALYTWGDTGLETIGTAVDPLGGNDELAPGTYLASDGTAMGAGSFAAAFGGDSTFGSWTLNLSDDSGGDPGSIDGWSISFTSTAAIPEPGSIALLGLIGVACVIRRRR